ncbi:homoserine kinase [Leucobacter sp. OH2974_COT-288]|nr:homoserine kinase [Leucobacter sp. OH2974_COT-288]
MTVTVKTRVPATSANLGPGFDCLGLALQFGDEYTAAVTATAGVRVEVSGVGAGTVPSDERNLLAKSVLHVYGRLGIPAPGLLLTAQNRIPHGRGMGSSGAAIVGGVKLATGLLAATGVTVSSQQQLQFATEIEGHPDNVAPGLYGGLTVSWMEGETAHAEQLTVHPDVAPLVLVPDFEVATKVARSLQPQQVPHQDAVFNVSRTALLLVALTAKPELLFAATADKLHQDYRGPAMPMTHQLVHQLREAGYAAVVSGAGPSVLVLGENAERRAAAAQFVTECAPTWEQKILAVAAHGATVEEV